MLALVNIGVGLAGDSTSVVAAGVEFAGDVIASTLVLAGMIIASRPPDVNHPYGHGRFEILSGLVVGMILAAGGLGICIQSLQRVDQMHPPPSAYGIWSLALSIVVKTVLSVVKFRAGRRLDSAALIADAWNDTVDILSSAVALVAVGMAISDPGRFLMADHYGGFAVGVIVIGTGLRVVRDTTMELTDTMPSRERLDEVIRVARSVAGVLDVEKCFARKTGLQYHVDIHIEVDPQMSVWDSHGIAMDVRQKVRDDCGWVADVLVHVEPSPQIARELGRL
jgi:cation diffusion facilitator family transporter